MEEDRRNSDLFNQDSQGEAPSTNLQNENATELQLQSPPLSTNEGQQPQDRTVLVEEKIPFREPNEEQQDGINQEEHEGRKEAETTLAYISTAQSSAVEGKGVLNESHLQEHSEKGIGRGVAPTTEEAQEESTMKSDERRTSPETSKDGSDILPQITEIIVNELETANADVNKKLGTTERAMVGISPVIKTEVEEGMAQPKKAPKRPRAKPGFGLRTSRTTIVETGQKRRSCICTNSKLCNELMTRWAKVSPPDYHYVQLPREHNPIPFSDQHATEAVAQNGGIIIPGKNRTPSNRPGEPSHNNESIANISDTEVYKNGFRYATLRNIQAKNPLPKDERVALCHYHPEVRPYLFWPKNTPSAQKYAIPVSLAMQLGYDTVANKCQGFNTEKYCYAVPTYSFEDAKEEIGSIEKAFNDRVSQIKTNPTQFVRDLRQCEEELKEVHKLRRRNAELLRRLDDRRRTIKRLRSVLKVQRQERPQGPTVNQQQQLAAQVASVNAQAHTVSASTTIHQQYHPHTYAATTAYHQQQQLIDTSQQQQATAIPQPLGQQNHNQVFLPPPPTQEQQAIGIVVGGLAQNAEQQHEQQHHWTFAQYTPNTISGSTGTENEQQHSQQQVQLPGVHTYDPTQHQQQHDQQHQQQPVPSPMEDHNNPGNSFSYAQQLEAAMAAAVAAGFKDDQEDVDQHQHHGEIVGDVVDLDELEHHDGFGGDHGEDDDLEDDDWSDTEQYRQSAGVSQSQQRPRKWPRKSVVLPPVSVKEVEDVRKKAKRSSKKPIGTVRKRAKTTKSVATKIEKTN